VTLFDGSGDQIWTADELAAALNSSEAYITEQAEAGVLPSFKYGGELLFSKAELERWIMKVKALMKAIEY
jgi:excisionase family DNA binding protein